MLGKIIQYDPASGKGVIILENGEKKDFVINQWKSFNILPEYGVVVQLENDFIIPINTEKLDTKRSFINDLETSENFEKSFHERIFPFVQEQVKRGWKLEVESDDGFTLIKDEKDIKFGTLIIFFISWNNCRKRSKSFWWSDHWYFSICYFYGYRFYCWTIFKT